MSFRNIVQIFVERVLLYCSVKEGIFHWWSKLLSCLWSGVRNILCFGLFITLGRFLCWVSKVCVNSLTWIRPQPEWMCSQWQEFSLEWKSNQGIRCETHFKIMEFWTKPSHIKSLFRTNEAGRLIACLPLHWLQWHKQLLFWRRTLHRVQKNNPTWSNQLVAIYSTHAHWKWLIFI